MIYTDNMALWQQKSHRMSSGFLLYLIKNGRGRRCRTPLPKEPTIFKIVSATEQNRPLIVYEFDLGRVRTCEPFLTRCFQDIHFRPLRQPTLLILCIYNMAQVFEFSSVFIFIEKKNPHARFNLLASSGKDWMKSSSFFKTYS